MVGSQLSPMVRTTFLEKVVVGSTPAVAYSKNAKTASQFEESSLMLHSSENEAARSSQGKEYWVRR